MKLARFWTRESGSADGPAGHVQLECRGWSNESLDAAKQMARELAGRMAARIAAGSRERHPYLYGDRPLPEPVIEEFAGDSGPRALITRNVYGALVLNASEMMFLDVDREDKESVDTSLDFMASLRSFFGKKGPEPPKKENSVVRDMNAVAASHGLSLRVYRTAAGYRGIVTNQKFNPEASSTEGLLREFGCDPLYIRLCKLQQSFRARLTPKPWRCGANIPPSFPFANAKQEAAFHDWHRRYTSQTAGLATCELLSSNGSSLAEFADLVRRHDQETRATSGNALA
jgi:hypothetical protein